MYGKRPGGPHIGNNKKAKVPLSEDFAMHPHDPYANLPPYEHGGFDMGSQFPPRGAGYPPPPSGPPDPYYDYYPPETDYPPDPYQMDPYYGYPEGRGYAPAPGYQEPAAPLHLNHSRGRRGAPRDRGFRDRGPRGGSRGGPRGGSRGGAPRGGSRGPGDRGRGSRSRGGGRGGGRGGAHHAPAPAEQLPIVEDVAPYKNPIEAFENMYPTAVWEQTLNIRNTLGSLVGFQVAVEGKTFYGEGSSKRIAQGLAALDVLNYIKAPGVDNMSPVCNVYSEMKRAEEIREEEERDKAAKKAAARAEKGGYGGAWVPADSNPAQFKRQAVPKGPNAPQKGVTLTPTLVNFQLLRQKYVGNQNEGDLIQTFTPNQSGMKTCVLIVQGHVFKGNGENDKIARDRAAAEAIIYFEANPPQFVQQMKPKKERKPVYDRPDPDNYSDMLFCKAWKFAVEMTKDINPVYAGKQNIAFVLKVYGPVQDIDSVEVVAMASGAKIIAREYMSADGFAINDCGGEVLCMRAFRRYLLNQLINLTKGTTSIFRRNPFGRIMMKEGYKFVFGTNCSPMGDSKVYDTEFYNALRNKKTFDTKDADALMSTSLVMKGRVAANQKKKLATRVPFNPKNCGKLHVYRKMAHDHVPDQCVVPTEDLAPYITCIPAPAAKIALRNVVGFQGALLSNVIDSVYFPEIYIGRAFDKEALTRSLYKRLQGGEYPSGVHVRTPEIVQWVWKPSRMADKTTIYAFAWCEGCNLDILRADIGSVVEMIKPADVSSISEEMLRAYDSREIKSASPSQFCDYNYYVAFTELLKTLDKPVESYTKLKKSAVGYQAAKQAVYTHLKKAGFGTWPKRFVHPNF